MADVLETEGPRMLIPVARFLTHSEPHGNEVVCLSDCERVLAHCRMLRVEILAVKEAIETKSHLIGCLASE
jgi:hypothetical protein